MRKINVNEKSLDDKKGDVWMFLEQSKTCMIVSLSLLGICIILIAMPVVRKEQAIWLVLFLLHNSRMEKSSVH